MTTTTARWRHAIESLRLHFIPIHEQFSLSHTHTHVLGFDLRLDLARLRIAACRKHTHALAAEIANTFLENGQQTANWQPIDCVYVLRACARAKLAVMASDACSCQQLHHTH